MTQTAPESSEQITKRKPILCFLDLETTATSNYNSGIIQIAMIVDNPNKKGVAKEWHFNSRTAPFKEAAQWLSSAKFHGFKTLEDAQAEWRTYPSPVRVFKDMGDGLDKHINSRERDKVEKIHMVGFNILRFDEPLLRFWFKCLEGMRIKATEGATYAPGCWFWQSPIDVMALAAEKLKEDRGIMDNFQLSTVAKHCGIEVDESQLHGAHYDAALTRALYYHLVGGKANGDEKSGRAKRGEDEAPAGSFANDLLAALTGAKRQEKQND